LNTYVICDSWFEKTAKKRTNSFIFACCSKTYTLYLS
jgi:hypothetical protein